MTQSERALEAIQEAVAGARAGAVPQIIEPSMGEALVRKVGASVDEVFEHMLNKIANWRSTVDLVERALLAKRKSHEDQLRDFVGFAERADAILESLDHEVRQMGALILEMPVTKPDPEPERPTLIGQ